ncbi:MULTISPECIES: type III secretion system needle filament subunit SctF [Pandoraea]|uniref:type III secretion system needle filament subunit SctF n=1 Tax=Pandoraea TaxID=93217 RepID=UPI001F5CE36A|nr:MULTISPECIES: type III secretion system needle filament subunit SctF [Pandoraea]MCI3207283.1 EscF/YscF/HrpA family type III secretion system needle major subunit [Pandoraea sp. LA3]MDN4585312.1 EscF/YscF/HrpA family type III secretion system needle major subunit [Pandoraea capi]
MADIIPSIRSSDQTYLEEISAGFNGPVDALKQRMEDALQKVKDDPTDSASMASFQAAMAAYTSLRAGQSGTIKSLKDAVQGVVSKF